MRGLLANISGQGVSKYIVHLKNSNITQRDNNVYSKSIILSTHYNKKFNHPKYNKLLLMI